MSFWDFNLNFWTGLSVNGLSGKDFYQNVVSVKHTALGHGVTRILHEFGLVVMSGSSTTWWFVCDVLLCVLSEFICLVADKFDWTCVGGNAGVVLLVI